MVIDAASTAELIISTAVDGYAPIELVDDDIADELMVDVLTEETLMMYNLPSNNSRVEPASNGDLTNPQHDECQETITTFTMDLTSDDSDIERLLNEDEPTTRTTSSAGVNPCVAPFAPEISAASPVKACSSSTLQGTLPSLAIPKSPTKPLSLIHI